MIEWKQSYVNMLEDCVKSQSVMKDWEAQIIEDLYCQFDSGLALSEREFSQLLEIWKRVMGVVD